MHAHDVGCLLYRGCNELDSANHSARKWPSSLEHPTEYSTGHIVDSYSKDSEFVSRLRIPMTILNKTPSTRRRL